MSQKFLFKETGMKTFFRRTIKQLNSSIIGVILTPEAAIKEMFANCLGLNDCPQLTFNVKDIKSFSP